MINNRVQSDGNNKDEQMKWLIVGLLLLNTTLQSTTGAATRLTPSWKRLFTILQQS